MANPSTITTKPGVQSILNTINPFSGFSSSSKDYVPEWLIKAFGGDTAGAKTAHIVSKIGAGAVVLGGAAWLLRAVMHSLDVDNIEALKSNSRASQKLETTKDRLLAPALRESQEPEDFAQKDPYDLNLAQEAYDEMKNNPQSGIVIKKKALLEPYNFALGAIPPLTAMAAMLASFKLADKHFDTKLSKKLDKDLAEAQAENNRLAYNRIARTRGLEEMPSKEDIEAAQAMSQNEDLSKKAASIFPREIETPAALLLAVLMVTGGIAGFNWQQANSPNVAKYKAYKKGLQSYNKERILGENVENSPLDPQMLAALDKNVGKKQKASGTTETSLKELFI